MANFVEVVRWDSPILFRDNQVYGLGRPILENVLIVQRGLTSETLCGGRAVYQYDFGRNGTITTLNFHNVGPIRFRIKAANTPKALKQATYPGTVFDYFPGSMIDSFKYSVTPNAYTVTQNNGIFMTGTQSGSGLFTNPVRMSQSAQLSGTYAVRASMRFQAGESLINSGGLSFLELDDSVNNIQVQKYVSQIRTRLVDNAGLHLGRDVDNNDIILGEPVDIYVNDDLKGDTLQLTDGIFGTIKDQISDPTVVDEFDNLKTITELTNFFGRTTLPEDYARILGIRADYSLTGILVDLQRGLFYRPKRINGYYALRTPIVGAKADLFANNITSYNLESGQYVYAEKNDTWTTTLLVSAGVHYYRFMVDGQAQIDSAAATTVQLATGQYSLLVVDSTQFVEFIYNGPANGVFVTGTFNNFGLDTMSVGFDPSEILKINFEDKIYYNKHHDWHKLEVEFDQPISIVGIRFLTGVPFENKQRVRILLDDQPITQDGWKLLCASESEALPGASLCATYSNLLEGNHQEPCKSYYINNTDVITASEDGWIEWSFTNENINNRETKKYTKLALLTRLENGAIYHRAHRGLEIILPDTEVTKVTDYIISDNEIPFRTTRLTEVGIDNDWDIPQVVLGSGVNIVTPEQLSGETIVGEPVSVEQTALQSFIKQIDQSGISLNNVEIVCTRRNTLSHEIAGAIEVLDLGSTPEESEPPDSRFTRESFTRANDRLRVVVISIDVKPVRVYYLRLVGLPTTFRLELYETESNAKAQIDRIGYAESDGYDFQLLSTFINERPIVTPAGLVNVEVTNMIVCFDQNAANTIFINKPRVNV